MQLLLVLALLLCGGQRGVIDEVKPVLRELGGEEMEKAFDEAEKISRVISAAAAGAAAAEVPPVGVAETPPQDGGQTDVGLALKPVVDIADGDIVCSLSKYLSA